MPKSNIFAGIWKVIDSFPVAIRIYPKGIQGTILELGLRGNVIWEISSEAMRIPLFRCDAYEVMPKKSSSSVYTIKFGAFRGHIIDCTVKTCLLYLNTITINDGHCLLVCRKMEDLNYENLIEQPFSFLQALQDNYFSDLTLKANNGEKFYVHTCILKLSAPQIDWTNKNNPLSKLSEDIVRGILHYLYAQCLPEGVDEAVVNKILSAASEISGLEALVSLCQLYIRNVTFKKKIYSLISETHECATQLIDNFRNKNSLYWTDHLASDPAKFCLAFKNSIREAAVIVSNLLVICDLFEKQKHELSKEDSHEIISYANTRIPIFVSQLQTFFKLIKRTFNYLTPVQKRELAAYLIQELETVLDTVSLILAKVKFVMEAILADYEIESVYYEAKPEILEDYFNALLCKQKAHNLKGAIRRVASLLVHSHRKKEKITGMVSRGNKIRLIVKEMDQFVMEDIPIFALWVDEFIQYLEEKLKWTEYQFCFKVGISKANEIIRKLVAHKECLQDVLVDICDLVQRDSFAKNLVTLGILDSENPAEDSTEVIQEENSMTKTPGYQITKISTKNYFCVPPPAHRSRLSEAANELLKSGLETDMVFEIINNGDSDNVVEPKGELPVELQPPLSPRPKYCTMSAHRVIVSARCDWFKRALLSGMQESIERKIQVYDTTPHVFSLLLKYLYCGQLDCTSLSVDHLSELLLLSDRYELDSLKGVSEYGLKPHLDVDSVIYFYGMADRFNAAILKKASERFIVQHPKVMEQEIFKELPKNLQNEICDVVVRSKYKKSRLSLEKVLSTTSCTIEEIEDMIADFQINNNVLSSNFRQLRLPARITRIEAAFEALRELLGEEMTHYRLVEMILAADHELNRTVEFFFC